jgi:hypothetical protein
MLALLAGYLSSLCCLPCYNIFAGFVAMLITIARRVAMKILVADWLAGYDGYARGLGILSGSAG